MRRVTKSAMHPEFAAAWAESDHDWLTYIGSPMVYDGELFVKRSDGTYSQMAETVRRKLMSHVRRIVPDVCSS